MSANKDSDDIKNHGVRVDKKRVQCNYCAKIVSGFGRLKFHLGGVRGDVKPCLNVPDNVKRMFENLVFKRGNIAREVDSLDPPEELPPKRQRSVRSNNFKHSPSEDEVEEGTPSEFSRKIGRFFYQNLIDVSAVDSGTFRELMCSAMGSSGHGRRIPSSEQLKGKILQTELTEMKDYVLRIKRSWYNTGCSILLDAWTDEQGRELITFLVDCPGGPIYLKSSNISSLVSDVGDLKSLLDKVIEEVGAEYVVQIVACSSTGWLGECGEQFLNESRTVFWTVTASHCIDLMLEKIRSMGSVQSLLEKATRLGKFILKLVKDEDFTVLDDFSMPCLNGNSVSTDFTTLEKIVVQKEKLEELVTSLQWEASVSTSMEEVKEVVELIKDPSFWTEAMTVLKATGPLIRVLSLIQTSDEPFIGYIYETMDQVKEEIKKGFKNKESQYMPFWDLIDNIWNGHLHSPLHAAGYYLNPSLFYSSDFNSDTEVAFGLLCSIVRMVQDLKTQDMISVQLDKYRQAQGPFAEGKSTKCRRKPPLEWWSIYGRECPELQRFATRVLSQTCDGPSRYGLRREMAQRLLESEMKYADQQEELVYQRNLAFLHYNLQLRHLKKRRLEGDGCCEELRGNPGAE